MATPRIVRTGPTAQYVFERGGGAIVHARLSIWSGAGTPDEKRAEVLLFEDSLDSSETFTRTLPTGAYVCVLLVFVREDLNGTFNYRHVVAGKSMAKGEGDVNLSAADGEGKAARHEYGLIGE